MAGLASHLGQRRLGELPTVRGQYHFIRMGAMGAPGAFPGRGAAVITSYSIHYTKLYEITGWARWAQLAFYVLAGVSWIFPLKPLFAWMNRGVPPPEED